MPKVKIEDCGHDWDFVNDNKQEFHGARFNGNDVIIPVKCLLCDMLGEEVYDFTGVFVDGEQL